MSRALVWQNRTSTGGWRSVGVFLATPRRLDGRALPGDTERARWFETIINDAQRPALEPYNPQRGTWEDWIEWALSALSNGHDSMMTEVEPEPTADMLYQREVLGITPTIQTPSQYRPTSDIPPLTGRKASDIRPTQPAARA